MTAIEKEIIESFEPSRPSLTEHESAGQVIKPRVHVDTTQKTVLDAFHRDAFANRFSDDYGKLPDDDGIIRYGNKICLKHVRSGRYLHSEKAMVHEARLKGGQPQYKVVSQNWTPHKAHDYWLVLPCLGQSQLLGKPVPYNKELRLQHVETHGQLRAFRPTVGSSAEGEEHIEVTVYPESLSDVNDVWRIQYFVFSKDWESAKAHRISERSDDKVWKIDDMISLRHKVTKLVLESQVERKGEAKISSAPVECAVAADMGAIWRIQIPDLEEDIPEALFSAIFTNTPNPLK